MGAEDYLWLAPGEEEVQGAVSYFEGLFGRGFQVFQKPFGHFPLLS